MNKPRLIDANKLHYALIDLFQEIDNMYIAGRVISLANLQPTAYDVDKVVEQLEELPNINQNYHSSTEMIDREDVIEIVKGGAE